MKKKTKATVFIRIFIVLIIVAMLWKELSILLIPSSYNNVNSMAKVVMKKTSTPGAAMVISRQGKLEYKCYGYADVKHEKKINEESLFEIGSTTKAFTALAIILLEEEGDLSGTDCITDYVSWFTPTYNGKYEKITIDQLLAHTSGIPPWSIRLIPEGTKANMLERTIRNISTINLESYPGTKHNYATVNYDILALIIEKITGERFQDFVTDNILLPLGMTESYFSTGHEKISNNLTKGYKAFFGNSVEYRAPRYNGNIAAGYLVTNVKDLGLWMNAQLGVGDIPVKLKRAIDKSHVVDKESAGYEELNKYYSYGWNHDTENGVISHSGSNPNYSSQVIMNIEKQEAIFVLANLDSSAPTQIAYNTYKNMNGKKMGKFGYNDTYLLLDMIFSVLSTIVLVSLCFKLINWALGRKKLAKVENMKTGTLERSIIVLFLKIILLIIIIIWPYFMNCSFYVIKVWMSNAILVWEGLAVIDCVLAIITELRTITENQNVEIMGCDLL